MSERKVYTRKEVQDMLGIGECGLRTLIKKGFFDTIQLGRHTYIMKKSFEEWLDDPDHIVIAREAEESSKGDQDMSDTRCYTVTEVQKMLGVSRKVVYELLKRNEFRSVQVGAKHLISKKSFDAWLDNIPSDPEYNKQL